MNLPRLLHRGPQSSRRQRRSVSGWMPRYLAADFVSSQAKQLLRPLPDRRRHEDSPSPATHEGLRWRPTHPVGHPTRGDPFRSHLQRIRRDGSGRMEEGKGGAEPSRSVEVRPSRLGTRLPACRRRAPRRACGSARTPQVACLASHRIQTDAPSSARVVDRLPRPT